MVGECDLEIVAPVTGATSATVHVVAQSVGFDTTQPMTLTHGNAYRIVTVNNAATFKIEVRVDGPGGTAQRSTTFANTCKP